MTSIGKSIFSGCSNLTNVTIGNSVTSIGSYAFSACSSLTSITIPKSVTEIGSNAFKNCISLDTVHISDIAAWCKITFEDEWSNPLTYANGHLYLNDEEVKHLKIPDSTTKINDYAFSACSSLTNLTIPKSVSSIGEKAFCRCFNLTSITIPPSMKRIGHEAFIGVTADVYISDLDAWVSIYFYSSSSNPAEHLYLNGELVKDLSGLSSATQINSYSFQTEDLTDVVIPSFIKNIRSYAFVSNQSLEKITIQNDVAMEDGAFYTFNKLSEIIVDGQQMEELNLYAFYSYYGVIQSLTIGSGVHSIKKGAHTPMKTIWLGSTPPEGYEYAAGKINYVSNDKYTALPNCKVYPQLGSMFKVNGIKYVPLNPSERTCDAIDCEYLDTINIVIPPTVSYKDVEMTVNSINPYTFYGQKYIKTVSIPQSVTCIGDSAFSNCPILSDFVIENRETKIEVGSGLFANSPIDSVYIGGKITYTAHSPFYQNPSIRTIVIGDREETIHEYEFYGCDKLQTVSIGNSVREIGNQSFSGCKNLKQVVLGNNVDSIGQSAFSECVGIMQFITHTIAPPICGLQALNDINKWECTLKVPEGYKTAYQAADQWKDFFFIEDVLPIQKYTLTYTVNGEVYQIDSVALNSHITPIDIPTKEGHTFSGWSEIPATMPAQDVTVEGTFTVNSYRLVYLLDGAEYSVDSIAYGTELVQKEVPTKEGYTFSGWSEIPATMLAQDVTVEGSFTVNSYRLVYQLDGEEYSVDSIAYGTELILKDAPTKEGYTFSGWSEIPATMPAKDVTVEGSFTVNHYTIIYIVDGEVYATEEIAYGEPIVLKEIPEKEGHTFSGWSEIPETMPAHDVTVMGSFEVDDIDAVVTDRLVDVYTLQGVMVKRQMDINELEDELPKGVYIVEGHKLLIK